MSFLSLRKLVLTLAFAALHSLAWSQTFTTLLMFNGTDGATPVDTPWFREWMETFMGRLSAAGVLELGRFSASPQRAS